MEVDPEISITMVKERMFKRKWLVFGPIRSNEGFSISYGHKTINYSDDCGSFQIGYEDDRLFAGSLRLTTAVREVSRAEKAIIIDRILRALEWDGHQSTTKVDPDA